VVNSEAPVQQAQVGTFATSEQILWSFNLKVKILNFIVKLGLSPRLSRERF
jgi:hypothetical protein